MATQRKLSTTHRALLFAALLAASICQPARGADALAVSRWAGLFRATRGPVTFVYNLRAGTASVYTSRTAGVSDFHSAVKVRGTTYSSRDYPSRHITLARDTLTVTLTAAGKPVMRQRFTLPAGGGLLVRVELAGKELSSNWMAPIVAESRGCVDIEGAGDVRALKVPFDNDQWSRYETVPIDAGGVSHEVAAFYDNDFQRGMVIGSVTHDTWKTGILFAGSDRHLDALTVWGGIADAATRDVMPHGSVTGGTIVSPTIMVGFNRDWRDAMEAFADANAAQAPPLKWTGGVPFGWNSWGKVKTGLTYAKAVAVSDFFAGPAGEQGFHNDGAVYINLDSYWDNLTDAQLKDFAAHAHANGQKAGIYWAPFIYWGKSLSQTVEGSLFAYGDIVLRNATDAPLTLDGGMAVDPTHPGTLRRIDHFIDRFRRAGFDYIKLDFLTHGALEARHHDPAARTGLQAYNAGMEYLVKRIGGRMFISASIAPMFPYRYAHARRICCDSFGALSETEYVMNAVTYGWWTSGRLYAFNDPDHVVLEGHSPAENISRVTSAAVAGTVFLSGDDVTQPEGQRLVLKYLTNPSVNGLARLGKAFRPVTGDAARSAAEMLELKDGDTRYLALFNYRPDGPAWRQIDLAAAGRAGIDFDVTDLWGGRSWTAHGNVTVRLEPAQATIIRLRPRPSVLPAR